MRWMGWKLLLGALLGTYIGFLLVWIACSMAIDPHLPYFFQRYAIPIIIGIGIFFLMYQYEIVKRR